HAFADAAGPAWSTLRDAATRRAALLATSAAPPRRRLLRRNDRQQQVRLPAGAKVQGGDAAEQVERPVARIVVQEWPAACELVLEIREFPPARSGIDVVLAANREADAVAGWNHDRGWPNLDVELDHLAFPRRLRPVVAVVGPVGHGEILVELAVRGAQPALPDPCLPIDRA